MIRDFRYKNAVIHNLSLASFMDADGGGVGDFLGLLRLDYLLRGTAAVETPGER